MKYLALLRDSFREAMDSKILYFTLAVCALIILFLGSIYFHPMTVREQAEAASTFLNSTMYNTQMPFEPVKPKCRVVEAEQLNDATEPWNGNYRVVFELYLPPGMADPRKSTEARGWLSAMIYEQFSWMDNLAVQRVNKHENDLQKNNSPSPKTPQANSGNPNPKQDKEELKGQKRQPEEKRTAQVQTGKANKNNTKSGYLLYIVTNTGCKPDTKRNWPHEARFFFGLLPMANIPLIGMGFMSSLSYSVYWIDYRLVNNFGGSIIVLFAVIVTSSFIPNMLQKGTVDLLLVKPMTRPVLLVLKFLGGLSFVLICTAFLIVSVWIVLGFRTGIWPLSFLLTIPILVFFYAILHAISTLFGVVTRNSLICILMTILFWAIFVTVGFLDWQIHAPPSPQRFMTEDGLQSRPRFVESSEGSSWYATSIDMAHSILPRTGELGTITTYLLTHELLTSEERRRFEFREPDISFVQTFGVSLAYIVALLGLACWRFSRQDY